MMGFEKKKSHGFLNWYKGRMRRLWPAVFIWMVVSAAVWNLLRIRLNVHQL